MFISFEGIDGAGKSTAIDQLKKFLIDSHLNESIVFTREPEN